MTISSTRLIDEHTIDVNRLACGWVLDAGCLGFGFTRELVKLDAKVLAIDPSPAISDPLLEKTVFQRVALVAAPVKSELYAIAKHPTANFLTSTRGPSHWPTISVPCLTITQLMAVNGIDHFDVVKLDIEASEYAILLDWPGPIANQISVEFHDFLGLNPFATPGEYYRKLLLHLAQWYEPVVWPEDRRDCLFVLKSQIHD